MKHLSLRLRLLIAGTAAILIALALAEAGLSALFAAHVERRALAELSVQLDQVLAGVDRDVTGKPVLATAPADPRFQRPLGGLYWQIEVEGVLLRSRSLWDYALPLPVDELPDGAEHFHDIVGPSGETLLTVERSVALPSRLGGATMRAAVAMNRADLKQAEQDFIADLLPFTGLLAGVLILAGWVQILIGLRPLATVGRRVADVRSGAVSRLGSDFPSEVQPLAAEVDALLEQREAEIARARARAGDLAHGLKTPLQALLGETDRLRGSGRPEAADAIEDIAGAMRRHVDRELTRARFASRGSAARVDLTDLAQRVHRVVSRTAAGAGVDWDIDVPERLIAAADADDLTEALGALAENAARHARGRVRITGRRAGDQVILSVIDNGPGIPANRIEALMERGTRADTTGPGSGLGLAIAAEIAAGFGGQLTLHYANPGLEARLALPAAESPI
ncbi:MAG: HAMP domain-containing sensor histidine kinase [Paracoccaceae bacterium]